MINAWSNERVSSDILGGITGYCNEVVAFVAEIDSALDQPEPLVLQRTAT